MSLASELGVVAVDETAELVTRSSTVVVAVKPQGVLPLLEASKEQASGRLWLSIAAGVSLVALERALGNGARVLRAMPNTPALVGAGATGLCAGRSASLDDLALAKELLGAVGLVEVVTEAQMDAVTGLSGSGPAFVLLAIEALADAGVHAGLTRDVALRLATQTVRGTGALVAETRQHPATLKDAVTSPGGTTAAGLRKLEAHGFRAALIEAVLAAAARSKELSGH